MWSELVGRLKTVSKSVCGVIFRPPTELARKVVDQIKVIFVMMLLSLYAATLGSGGRDTP